MGSPLEWWNYKSPQKKVLSPTSPCLVKTLEWWNYKSPESEVMAQDIHVWGIPWNGGTIRVLKNGVVTNESMPGENLGMVELQESGEAGIGSRKSMLGESLGIVEQQEFLKRCVVTNESMPGENLGMVELQES